MYILYMNIEDIENKIEDIEKVVIKVKELIADYKICSSDITKALISSAVKKYALSISEFKLES